MAPKIPPELRDSFIGNPINLVTGEFLTTVNPIDIGKLREANMLKVNQPTKEIKIFVGSDANSFNKDWAAAFEVGGTFPYKVANVAVQLQASWESSKASHSFQFTATGQNYQYASVSLKNVDNTEVLYKCFDSHFRKKYDAVVGSSSLEEYWKNLEAFFDSFGHAVVSDAQLISGAEVVITYQVEDSIEKWKQKYGGSVTVATPLTAFNLVAGYKENTGHSIANTKLNVTQKAEPARSPAAKWASKFAEKYTDMALTDDKAKEARITNEDDGVDLEEFKLPPAKTLGEEPLPQAQVEVDKIDAQNRVMDQAKDWDAKGNKRTWENYKKWLDGRKSRATDPVDVSRQANVQMPTDFSTEHASTSRQATVSAAAAEPQAGSGGIEGFVVNGVAFKSWTELFPDLKMAFVPSEQSIRMAEAYTYYYSRVEFYQYLMFLQDVHDGGGKDIVNNDSIESDVAVFGGWIDGLAKTLREVDYSEEDSIKRLVNSFAKNVESGGFFSKQIYHAFFSKVTHKVIHQSPLGFILAIEDADIRVATEGMAKNIRTAIENWIKAIKADLPAIFVEKAAYFSTDQPGNFTPLPDPVSVLPMVGNAVRVYPIFQRDGQTLKLAAYTTSWIDVAEIEIEVPGIGITMLAFQWQDQWNVEDFFSRFKRVDSDDIHALVASCPAMEPHLLSGVPNKSLVKVHIGGTSLYAVGYEKGLESYRGAPMFQKLGYDMLGERLRIEF